MNLLIRWGLHDGLPRPNCSAFHRFMAGLTGRAWDIIYLTIFVVGLIYGWMFLPSPLH